MRNYANYTDEQILNNIKSVLSMSGLLKSLGLKPSGGNFTNMKRKLQQLNANCEHWTGQAWNRNSRQKDWSNYTKVSSLKKHLIKERGHKCEDCGLTNWKDKLIPLEIHHINGDRTDNNLNNLLLVCPNCHAFTDFYRNKSKLTDEEKKQKKKQYVYNLCICGNNKYYRSKVCINCSKMVARVEFESTNSKF